PNPDSAPDRLVRALDRIQHYEPPFKVLPVVDEFLRAMAETEPADRARQVRNIKQALKDHDFQASVERDQSLNYLLPDTISLTMMGGSQHTNVRPPEAWANLDVRLLPGEDPRKFLETIRHVVDDPEVTITPATETFQAPNYSPTSTPLYAAIQRVASRYF